MTETARSPQTLGDFTKIVRRRKWWFVAVVFVVTAGAVGWSASQPKVYRATTTVIIRTAQAEALFPSLQTSGDPKRRVLNEISVMQGATVRQRVIDDLQLAFAPPAVSGGSTATADVVTLSVSSGRAEFAAEVANAYVAAYNEVKADAVAARLETANAELQQLIDDLQASIDELDDAIARSDTDDDTSRETQRRSLLDQQAEYQRSLEQQQVNGKLIGNAAEVVHVAAVPSAPDSPKPLRTGLVALFGGLLLGLGVALTRERLDRAVNGLDDFDKLGTTLPVLAVVPHVDATTSLPLSLQQPRHMAVESYRVLRTGVEFLAVDRGAKVLQVTSAVPSEGKTTTAVNLAVVLAAAGSKVVLVDADLRLPRVHEQFGVPAGAGLVDNLVGLGLSGTVRNITTNLDLVTAGRVASHPSEMLGSKRMASLLDGLKQRYDFVLLDSAPVLPVSDARALARLVDGVVLVVKAGGSTVARVRHAISLLEQLEAPILGIVLNDVDISRRAERDQYGYGYGYGEGYGDSESSGGSRA